MVPTRQHDITMYQSSFRPPDRVLVCDVSKEPHVFVPFLDKCDIGSDRSELLMEAYFIKSSIYFVES
jgi:hypothetical protein